MRLLVLGAGAIGGYFGGRLAECGVDVTFLVRPARREQLDRDGLRIQSPLGDYRGKVQTVLSTELEPRYDFVLLTCKAYDLESAMDSVAPAMTGTCAVVPMLNGVAHFDTLDARFGRESVMGGTCAIGVALGSDGVIRHSDAVQRITFGERDRSVTARAHAFADAFGKTKVTWELAEDIEQNIWEKIVFLSALAATTCLFRANVRELIAAPGGREAVERALAVNIEIATREGHVPRAAAIEMARKRLTDPEGTWSSSMLHDLEKGGRVESDHIIGWMLARARSYGLDDTMLSMAFTHLKAYEVRRAAARLPRL
jgi:2-dehydropantoate 2-reductase